MNPNAVAPDYDPDMAEQILDDAGYPRGADGWRFELDLMPQTSTSTRVMGEIIKEQFEAIGIKINFQLYDHVTVGTMERAGDFDIISNCPRYGPSPLDGYYANYHPEGLYNKGRIMYDNPEFTAVMEEALSEFDIDKRRELIWECQKILAEDFVNIPIVGEQKIQISNINWRGQRASVDVWGKGSNWFCYRCVWNVNNVETEEPTDIEDVINDLQDELDKVTADIALFSDRVADSLDTVTDAIEAQTDMIGDVETTLSSDVASMEETVSGMKGTIGMLQTLLIVTLLVAIVAVVVPFIKS
jgi:hypothetical protein